MPLSTRIDAAAPAAGAATGECRYLPHWLEARHADALLVALHSGVEWHTEEIRLFGRSIVVPRLVSWCGDAHVNYRYSGRDHRCVGWPPVLVPLRERLASELGFSSSFVLLNRYRDGRDGMGWHTDDEPGLGTWFASLSLGAARQFRMRPWPDRPAQALELAHGSLLLLRGMIPHALPKSRRPLGERINLTFRQLMSDIPRG